MCIRDRIITVLREPDNAPPYVDLLHAQDDKHTRGVRYYFGLDPDLRILRIWAGSEGRLNDALARLDQETGFFGAKEITLAGKTYTWVEDLLFARYLGVLAWGTENEVGIVADSDGDGYTDEQENAADTDPFDSEDHP